MAPYTNTEYLDMLLLYGETGQNLRAAERLYRERFPHRRHPSGNTILRVVQRVRDTGKVMPSYEGRGPERPRRVQRAEDNLLHLVEMDPGISTRTAARQLNISHGTVHNILRNELLYPYHVQKVQRLLDNDFPRRATFCEWFRETEIRHPNLRSVILFTDECCFTKDGVLNYHNIHHWAYENPHEIHQSSSQHRISINVWAGILGDHLLGPHVLPHRLNAVGYLNFLQNTLPDYLDDIPLDVRRQMWFMHDGAPPHAARPVQEHLNQTFAHWIGRGGTVPWPARSPDFNPLDFFLWGYLKNLVYDRRQEILDVEDLRDRVVTAAQLIRQEMPSFQAVHDNFSRRIEACIRARGGHFEHLLL